MSDENDRATGQRLRFYASAPHPCSYLPDREAASIFVDPNAPVGPEAYSTLIEHGFRRSGCVIYRPQCPACDACIPVRVPTAAFRPDRSQMRTWRKNQDLHINQQSTTFNAEHYALYRRYVAARHGGGSMADATPDEYMSFLTCPGIDSMFVEFRSEPQLCAVAVIDKIRSGLSSVYTFYDPDTAARGLGTFCILWTIAEAKRLQLPYVYLGFWIPDCRKMAYKSNFRPFQTFDGRRWRTS